MIMLKAFKYELDPTDEQKVLLNKHFGCCRFIYNWALEEKQRAYTEDKRTLSCFELINKLPELRETNLWLKEVQAQALQQAISHLDTAFTSFFKKNGRFPRFKSKHRSKATYSIPQFIRINYEDSKIFIPKLHYVKFFKDKRRIDGKIKTCTISKSKVGRYYISILVDNDKPLPDKVIPELNNTIGIDLGIKDFAIISNGDKIANPKYFIKQQAKLKVHQQRLAKKKLGSKARDKQRIKVAKIYEKISNQRKDFQHKLSTKLISENQAICMEDLNVEGLIKNHSLAKHIADVSWSQFVNMINYKCEWYGKNFIQIGRFEPSSKMCSSCGTINSKLTLADREWTCQCGAKHDRDINAAINIKNFGWSYINKQLGAEVTTPSINKAYRRDVVLETRPAMVRSPWF